MAQLQPQLVSFVLKRFILQHGRYPWIASVTFSSRPRPENYGGCAATLIASRWAITSGHCNYEYKDPPGRFIYDPIRYIVLGEHDINTIDALDTNRFLEV